MERFTEKRDGKNVVLLLQRANLDWHIGRRDDGDKALTHLSGDAIDRFAAYEDTGLRPERLKELAQAERDGRMVVLPRGHGCPMGYRGSPGNCQNCGGHNIRHFDRFDLSVCMDCGWDDEAQAEAHLIKMIRNAEIDISMLFEPVERMKNTAPDGAAL